MEDSKSHNLPGNILQGLRNLRASITYVRISTYSRQDYDLPIQFHLIILMVFSFPRLEGIAADYERT